MLWAGPPANAARISLGRHAGGLGREKNMPLNVSKTALERDPVALDPKHYKVELDNDRVRVVRIKYEALGKSVMHQHRPGVGTFLTDAKFKFTYPDGRSENIEAKAGDFMWFSEVWEHLPESLADAPFELVYVELKE
jgi:hypothetical protein